MASLPFTVFGLTEEQTETLTFWGIGTLGMLAALPEKELISRLGQAGKRLRQMARGEMPHFFQPVGATFALQERMELESPVKVLDRLMFVANLMLEQLIDSTLLITTASTLFVMELAKRNLASSVSRTLPFHPLHDRILPASITFATTFQKYNSRQSYQSHCKKYNGILFPPTTQHSWTPCWSVRRLSIFPIVSSYE